MSAVVAATKSTISASAWAGSRSPHSASLTPTTNASGAHDGHQSADGEAPQADAGQEPPHVVPPDREHQKDAGDPAADEPVEAPREQRRTASNRKDATITTDSTACGRGLLAAR